MSNRDVRSDPALLPHVSSHTLRAQHVANTMGLTSLRHKTGLLVSFVPSGMETDFVIVLESYWQTYSARSVVVLLLLLLALPLSIILLNLLCLLGVLSV